MQVFIYKQGDNTEVAKEGMPHLLYKKIFGFFNTSANPDTSPDEKEIELIFPFQNHATCMFLHEVWCVHIDTGFENSILSNMKKGSNQ